MIPAPGSADWIRLRTRDEATLTRLAALEAQRAISATPAVSARVDELIAEMARRLP